MRLGCLGAAIDDAVLSAHAPTIRVTAPIANADLRKCICPPRSRNKRLVQYRLRAKTAIKKRPLSRSAAYRLLSQPVAVTRAWKITHALPAGVRTAFTELHST